MLKKAEILLITLVVLAAAACAETAGRQTNGATQAGPSTYRPISARQRLAWYLKATVGPSGLAAGVVSAGLGTGIDRPEEYGPTWRGFGKRYAVRLSGVAIGNGVEAAMGAAWGEDPRYPRAREKSFGGRVGNVIKYTFLARNRKGGDMPAFARLAGNAGNNFVTNLWRADSDNDWRHAVGRIAIGIGGRAASNAWAEFWPSVARRLFHRDPSNGLRPDPLH